MAIETTTLRSALLLHAGGRICAIPLASVVEIMRPLPIDPIGDMPSFLRGLAIVRGVPVPVVDLGCLFGMSDGPSASRFVILRLDQRQVALAVTAVLGLCELDESLVQDLPPLLQDAQTELVTAVGVRDRHLLVVLQAAAIVPGEVWQSLQTAG